MKAVKLLLLIEKQIVGILRMRGLAVLKKKRGPRKLSNLVPTDLGLRKMGSDEAPKKSTVVTSEFVQRYRYLWPTDRRSTNSTVKEKAEAFVTKHPKVTLDEIIEAAQYWIQMNGPVYCGKAHFFFSKTEKSGIEISRLEEALEIIKEIGHGPSTSGPMRLQ